MEHTNKTHLTVLQPVATYEEGATQVHRLLDPVRVSVRWNKDYTSFRVYRCRWTDDASYARYQASDD